VDYQDPAKRDLAELLETVHSVFDIDLETKVRTILSYAMSCGMSAFELLRIVDSLQATDKY
jgi:alkyl hydroperoxide reductase subunit AhpC